MQLAAVKSDCSLFLRLYIACQSRDGDLDQFFSHENQAAPPALSTGGKLHLAVKADLLHWLKSDQTESTSPPVVDATIIVGAAIVQMLYSCSGKNLSRLCEHSFCTLHLHSTGKGPQTGLRLGYISS